MKVLHLPYSVGSFPQGLCYGERKINLDSQILNIYTGNILVNNSCDICLNKSRNKIIDLLNRLRIFLSVKNKYDIFHFNFGSSLIDIPHYNLILLDLPFYKGKKFVTFQGSDARQNLNKLHGKFIDEVYEFDIYSNERLNKIRKRKIIKFARYTDHIFALNPDLLHFLPREKSSFLPYAIADWDKLKPVKYKINKRLNIVHAPSNRKLKGSKYILNALKRIRSKYNNINIILVENVPRNKALEIYKQAHLVIDQLLIGWYGALSVEVMKLGKPVLCYIREQDLYFLPSKMRYDIHDAFFVSNKKNLYNTLEYIISNPDILLMKSEAAVDFVHEWHDPVKIAKFVSKFYEQ